MNTIRCALIRPLAAGLTLLALTVGSARGAELIDGGFETGAYVIGFLPASFGMWQGDLAEIVDATQRIILFEGSEMIRLIHTTRDGPSERLGGEAWQLVDLTPDAKLVATARAIARASSGYRPSRSTPSPTSSSRLWGSRGRPRDCIRHDSMD